jgi:hypothetical protein
MGSTRDSSPDATRANSPPRPPIPIRLPFQRISMFVAAIYPTPQQSCATHLPEDGYNIRSVQECFGNKGVKATMRDTHVLIQGETAVHSPLDAL